MTLTWLASIQPGVLIPTVAKQDSKSVEYFEKHIRPMLVQRCQSCHGPDKQKGGLRLDQPEWISQGGESGKIIVQGKASDSLLFQAVSYQHDTLKMPPRGKLTDEQIQHVKQWIDSGAGMPAASASTSSAPSTSFNLDERLKHWCYQPLKRVEIPAVLNPATVKTSIDPFFQQAWKTQQLQPSPTVSKSAWIRRVTYDLIGLPPTLDELDAFEKDTSDQAYASVVDRLLARKEYGERWARHWLDLMRYADTLGHEFDYDLPNAWRYRNYVIRALNDDVSYRQLVLEHLAGDLLPEPRINQKEQWNESIQGTGFLWLGEAKHGPVDIKQEQADRIDNQIDVIGKAFLGQTIACARCHDHKFDAIATRDYYALYGVLQSSRFQEALIDTPERQGNLIADLKRVNRELSTFLEQSQEKKDTDEIASAQAKSVSFDLSSCRPQGEAWNWSTEKTRTAYYDSKAKSWMVRSVPAGCWDSGQFSQKLEGSLRTVSFTIQNRFLHILAAGMNGRVRVIIDGFVVIRDPIYGSLRRVVSSPVSHWQTFDLNMWLGRQAYVEFLDDGPEEISMTPDQGSQGMSWLQVSGMVASSEAKPPEQSKDKAVPPVAIIHAEALKLLQERKACEDRMQAPRYSIATADGNGLDEHIFIRGNHRSPGERVPRGLSSVYCGQQELKINQGSGRLALAERLVDPNQNPLIARVIVNRVWKHHFGEGLVKSVDDFGRMGAEPASMELLDYLADWFVKEGWSLKKLHRELVLSHLYRLSSSQPNQEISKRDPQNTWLSRMPLRRLEAESLRDAMLAISGRWNRKSYLEGSKMPYLTSLMQGRGKPSAQGELDGDGYRSIYLSIRRNFLSPFLTSFDFPTPFTAIGKRSVSNTPVQGLALMNDPLVKELSSQWASKLLEQTMSDQERIDRMYRMAYTRSATKDELQLAQEFLGEQMKQHQHHEQKAWAELAHAVFCSKEFFFIP